MGARREGLSPSEALEVARGHANEGSGETIVAHYLAAHPGIPVQVQGEIMDFVKSGGSGYGRYSIRRNS